MMIKSARIAALSLAAGLLLATPAMADLQSYMTVTGAVQGPILGSSTQAGREDQIEVFEYHHLVEKPTAGSPLAHQTAIVSYRLFDRSVPKLMTAMANDESLTVVLTLWQPGGGGQEVHYGTVTLVGARVVGVETLSLDSRDTSLQLFEASVRVRFSYNELQYTHEQTGATAVLN